jgi:hypothetical protein
MKKKNSQENFPHIYNCNPPGIFYRIEAKKQKGKMKFETSVFYNPGRTLLPGNGRSKLSFGRRRQF